MKEKPTNPAGSAIPEDHRGMAEPLQIAGKRFRGVLTDAEISGCWSFAWLPESSGNPNLPEPVPNIRHKFLEVRPIRDPINARYMSPRNLELAAFIDAFSKHPDEVLQLLIKFRNHIKRHGDSLENWEETVVQAAFLEKGSGKDAAHYAAELAGVKSAAGVENIERKLQKKTGLVKGKPFLWPEIAVGSAEAIPVKHKKRSS